MYITYYTICGSDLYIYNGNLNKVIEKGLIIGYKAISIIEDIGLLIKSINIGDRVVILLVIIYSDCFYYK